MNWTLRLARLADCDRLRELLEAEACTAHWTAAQIARFFGAEDAVCLCAEVNGGTVGFVAGSVLVIAGAGAEAELENLVVAPEARRGGVGRELLCAFLGWCAERNASLVRLEVRAGNAAAITLYRAHGFVETGLRRRYYHNPEDDAVLMQRGPVTGGTV